MFYVPEATAMVTTGSLDRLIDFPAPDKVIGAGDTRVVEIATGDPAIEPATGFVGDMSYLQDGIDWWGESRQYRAVY
jgi:hypothetical protein